MVERERDAEKRYIYIYMGVYGETIGGTDGDKVERKKK